MNEYFTPGAEMKIDSISKQAVNGGLSGGNPDPLNQNTAWLYRRFRDEDFWALTGTTADDVFKLQDAIWMLEDEKAKDLHNRLIKFLPDHSTVASAADLAYVSVVYPVTYDSDGSISEYKQSQVTYTHAPEPGSLVLLGTGIAALGLGLRRRKK
jgi:hypothetical protein